MSIIITYDIPAKHQEFKNAMFKFGYSDRMLDSNNRTVYLPNTTLYHFKKTTSEALADAQNECKKLNVNLERCISTVCKEWSAIFGIQSK